MTFTLRQKDWSLNVTCCESDFFSLCCKDHLSGLLFHCWHQNCTTKLLVKYSNYSNIVCFMNIMPTYFKQLKQIKFYSLLNKYYLGIDRFIFLSSVISPVFKCHSLATWILTSLMLDRAWMTNRKQMYICQVPVNPSHMKAIAFELQRNI